MVVTLAGRAAEQVVFGRVTNGAANDLEKVTELARAMVFEYGMGETAPRARCAPTTTRSPRRRSGMRDHEQTRLTDARLRGSAAALTKHRALLDRVAAALLEKETLSREELLEIFGDVEPESRASETVGVVRALAAEPALSLDLRGSAAGLQLRDVDRVLRRLELERLVPVRERDRARCRRCRSSLSG